MSSEVIIKSFQNGLSVYLAPEVPFEELLEEIACKFRESGKFFQDAKLAVSLEGRELTWSEERQVIDVINENSGLKIVCLVGRDEKKDDVFFHALEQCQKSEEDDEGRFYKGTLKNGQILETESTIIMLGDVYPGSTIISSKNIIILGGLYGEAYAGANGEEEHFIVALEMSPSRLKIGDLRLKNATRQSKWPVKPKVQPKIAYISQDKIVVESITKELLSDITL